MVVMPNRRAPPPQHCGSRIPRVIHVKGARIPIDIVDDDDDGAVMELRVPPKVGLGLDLVGMICDRVLEMSRSNPSLAAAIGRPCTTSR